MQTRRERERERETHTQTIEKLAKFRSSSPSRFCGSASQEHTREEKAFPKLEFVRFPKDEFLPKDEW
jgi:hypothetical protein